MSGVDQMAISALVFSGLGGLDQADLRMSVVRIPEVMGRIREAQRLIDGLVFDSQQSKPDLLNAICASDDHFHRHAKLKSLAVAIVQVGLFDRYLRTQRKPENFVGVTGHDSAARVAAGLQTFSDLVLTSPAIESLVNGDLAYPRVLSLVTSAAPLLLEKQTFSVYAAAAGAMASTLAPTMASSMASNSASKVLTPATVLDASTAVLIESSDSKSTLAHEDFSDLRQAVFALNQQAGVTRFIHIGPAGGMKSFDYNQLGHDEIESLDSIEMDPMLGWFWRAHRALFADHRALAN